MGSITVTRDGPPRVIGNRFEITGTLSPSSSYASGGESFTSTLFSLGSVERLFVEPSIGGYVPAVDMANSKVLIFQESGEAGPLAQISGDKSAQAFPFRAIGAK